MEVHVPLILAMIKYGGPVAVGVILGLIPWWFAQQNCKSKDITIEKQNKFNLALQRETIEALNNAAESIRSVHRSFESIEQAIESVRLVVTSRSARR